MQEDIWTGIGAGISTIGTALSWWWNAGPLQILFSVLTGSFITYFAQTRLEKRRIKRENFLEMRNVIYGPLFKVINHIYGALESSEYFEREEMRDKMKDIETVMDHYLYFMVDKELRKAMETFYNRIRRYSVLEHAIEGVAKKITVDVIREKLDLQVKMNDRISYRLFVGSEFMKDVDLPYAILMGKTPKEIVEKESTELKGATIDITVGGYSYSDIEKLHNACQVALEKIKENLLFQEREAKRKLLAEQTQKIINHLKALIG